MRSFGNKKGSDLERLTEVELRSTESGIASTKGTQVAAPHMHSIYAIFYTYIR